MDRRTWPPRQHGSGWTRKAHFAAMVDQIVTMPGMLKHRLIFGPLMILVLLLLFYFDGQLDEVSLSGTVWQQVFLGRTYLPAGLVMLMVWLVLVAMAARELSHFFLAKRLHISPIMLAVSSMVGSLLIYIIPISLNAQDTMAIYASLLALVFLGSLIRHSYNGRTRGAIAAGSATMFATIYLGILPGFYLAIRRWQSPWVIVAILLIVKMCDVGAYATGRLIGRHKLIPWLSPGKTWEGLIGGVITSGLTAVICAAVGNGYGLLGYWHSMEGERAFGGYEMPLWYAFIAGMVLGFIGQAGDLTASLFKRDAGIKDSGGSIPGFGGVIDVLDSPIVAAPFAYWLLALAAYLFMP